ncbi:MAG: ABC transporter ATP-binding protein [Gemmatimonadaceae bacterium]
MYDPRGAAPAHGGDFGNAVLARWRVVAGGRVTLYLPRMLALRLSGISRRFGATLALDQASLTVREGSVHALLGENGAGKTTLMRVAFGLIARDTGVVELFERPVHFTAPADAIRAGMGMVHQHFSLVPSMTVAENLVLGGGALPGWRFDRGAAESRVRDLSREAGLPLEPSVVVESLPVSAQQRLEILKALARNARLLILDEPTAVLAPAEASELLAWLRRYVARGNAAVLITHRLREALAVADEVTVLRRGRVALAARAQDVTVAGVTAAMLGESAARNQQEAPTARVAPGAAASAESEVVAALHAVTAHAAAERQALRDATVAVRRGELLGVAAIEGSGQHALLRLLAGRLQPVSGRAELPVATAFIPEDRLREAIAPELTLTENVALRGAGARRGIERWAGWRARTAALLAAHDVRASGPEAPAHALSGGNQQKLVLARELSGEPALVVAENPTRGLDVRATAAVHGQLRDAARRGAAVVLYASDLDEVLALATRVVVVHDGRVIPVPLERAHVGRAMLHGSA